MIQILEGPSGSGKSYQLYKRMIEQAIREPERKFFLIVPEQFTMQAQRDIVTMHPRHGTMNIDIVSFNRLAYRVFEEQNVKCDHILEDFGKSMLLKRILLEYRKELPVFGANVSRDGFIDELKSLLTELFQYRISEEQLKETTKALEGHRALKQKLADLMFVYGKFQEEIRDTYIIAEHILEMLARYVPQSELLAGSVLFLDGYTGFTPIQYDLLEALVQASADITITVTIDEAAAKKEALAEHELFYLSKDTITRIKRLGERLDIYVEEEFLKDGTPRFVSSPELAFLEKNLFRYPYQVWKSEKEANKKSAENEADKRCAEKDNCAKSRIHIMAMKNTRQELQTVARQIHAMVREGRYRYKDIAIIHGSLEELAPIAEELLPQLDIPYFIDMNQSLYMNPCLESLRALLDIAEQDYSYDSVFRFLKTGVMDRSFSGFDDIEELENYCRKRGIRGESWWKRAFSEEKAEEIPIGQKDYRAIQDGILVFRVLQPITKGLKSAKTVGQYVQVLMNYLESFHMQEFLEKKVQSFEENGDYVQAKAYSQVYDKLMDIFEKLEQILSNAEMRTEEFHALLDTGLNDIALGVIPPSLDQLTIGDIERTRLNHVKVLYVMGVNDGIIPKLSRGAGILSEADRNILAGNLELAPDSRQQVFTEQFYLYQNITKPSDELYLTYHTQDSDGNETLPAYLIGRLTKLFPDLSIEVPVTDELNWERIETPKDSRDLLVTRLHEEGRQNLSEKENSIWKALYQYYQRDSEEVLDSLQDGVCYNNLGQLLSPETAARLYGKILNTSVSKLETYSRCPYQFFLEYGLKLHKREKSEVTLSDMGNLLHSVVEQVFRQVETRQVSELTAEELAEHNPWAEITDEELRTLAEKAVDRIAESEEGEVYHQTSSNLHLLKRIRETAAYAVVDLKDQLLKGSMVPYQFELSFNRRYADDVCKDLKSANIPLAGGTDLRLSGIIDRIDICQDDTHVYVKVLDYKSSQKEIEMTQVEAGLQLQLLIYTNVVMEVLKRQFPDKEIIPAGSLYYGFKLPMVKRNAKEETTQKNIAKATAMTGLINEDEPCIAYMGNEDILPVHKEKKGIEKKPGEVGQEGNGTLKIPAEAQKQENEAQRQEKQEGLTTEQYLELLSQVQDTVKELGEEMMEGEISIRPVRSGRSIPCDFCDYRDVCKLDVKDGGNCVVTAEQLKKTRGRKR